MNVQSSVLLQDPHSRMQFKLRMGDMINPFAVDDLLG